MLEKITVGTVEYELESKDAALVKTLQSLSKVMNELLRRVT